MSRWIQKVVFVYVCVHTHMYSRVCVCVCVRMRACVCETEINKRLSTWEFVAWERLGRQNGGGKRCKSISIKHTHTHIFLKVPTFVSDSRNVFLCFQTRKIKGKVLWRHLKEIIILQGFPQGLVGLGLLLDLPFLLCVLCAHASK